MQTGDTLFDALTYALDKIGGAHAPVAVVNASRLEPQDWVKQSSNACYKLENTLNGVFNTLLIRATRQTEETLGLVALATSHAANPGGRILIAQENAHGAGSLEKNLKKAFPNLTSIVKFKCRVMVLDVADGDPAMLLRWTERASIQRVKHNRGEFWSAPGVFSWDRPDPGSRLLLDHLPKQMPGTVADLGCGNGLLSTSLVKKEGITALYAIDADARAVESCRMNLADRAPNVTAHLVWGDATGTQKDWPEMDFVVMNPPFHTQQEESRELGQKFCNAAMKMLRSGGELYLVANRHMPYEAILEKEAREVTLLADIDGFKIIRARK